MKQTLCILISKAKGTEETLLFPEWFNNCRFVKLWNPRSARTIGSIDRIDGSDDRFGREATSYAADAVLARGKLISRPSWARGICISSTRPVGMSIPRRHGCVLRETIFDLSNGRSSNVTDLVSRGYFSLYFHYLTLTTENPIVT